MRAFYEDGLLEKLREGDAISVFGSDVVVKPIPDLQDKGVLDPREFELAKKTLAARTALNPSIENLRQETGFPNINLNTVEIITKVTPLEWNGIGFSLWSYAPRKPFGKKDRKAVIYMHGGSYFAGSVYGEENPLKYLAEKGDCVVFNVDYSLAPEFPFPIALEQLGVALKYVKEHAEELGIDAGQIYLSGDSAGGNIVLGYCTQEDAIKVAGLILFYPATALAFDVLPFEWKESDYEMDPAYKPYIVPRLVLGRSDGNIGPLPRLISSVYLRHGEPLTDVRVSPLFADPKCFPRTLLFTSEYDGLRIQGEYFAAKLNKSGVDCRCIRYSGVHHAFLDKFGYFPQAEDAILESARFMVEK